MILPLLLSAALQNAEPCSPRMLPMVTTSLPYSGPDGEVAGLIEFTSEASTSGRVLVVTYVRPGIAQVGTFTVEGDAQIQNLTNATANVKYRMSNRIEDGFVPIFDQGSPLCWDAEKQRIISDYVFEVPGQSEITVPVDWSVTIRRANQIADINADGVVDSSDQGILLADFGTDMNRSDLNFDGTVNGADLGILFGQWSETFQPGGG
jgi:hypothetical protein